jgi:EAL domain-containing protein (putative c-di-GMP-specific phosphodiesterase class I)
MPCDASSGSLVAVEALVRWQHPTRGLLSPDAFLGLIEQRGFTTRLTDTVLALAVAQARAWDVELPIAVNFTATDLLDEGLPARIDRLLAAHGLPAHALELEITEGLLLTDPAGATRTLADLRALGIAIAVDDYGTGYSSLAYLRDLPVDQLKIDRSFVTLEALREMGCEWVQGYHFTKPLPADALVRWHRAVSLCS